MILDNLVLDVGAFINEHPGGRFVIKHNIGTDISKFFFGGYSLEGNLEGVSPGHNHSAYARRIVNSIAIAVYERDIETVSDLPVELSQKESSIISHNLKNVVFAATKVSDVLPTNYSDERVIGKHFRVTSTLTPFHSRHYTISNIMEPQKYHSLCNALKLGS